MHEIVGDLVHHEIEVMTLEVLDFFAHGGVEQENQREELEDFRIVGEVADLSVES